jgi:hypothetical protein
MFGEKHLKRILKQQVTKAIQNKALNKTIINTKNTFINNKKLSKILSQQYRQSIILNYSK